MTEEKTKPIILRVDPSIEKIEIEGLVKFKEFDLNPDNLSCSEYECKVETEIVEAGDRRWSRPDVVDALAHKYGKVGVDHGVGPSKSVIMLGVPHGDDWLWDRMKAVESEVEARTCIGGPPPPDKDTDCGVRLDTGKKWTDEDQENYETETLIYFLAGASLLLAILAVALCYALMKNTL